MNYQQFQAVIILYFYFMLGFNFWNFTKRVLKLFGLLLIAFLIIFWNEIIYGIRQISGQYAIIGAAQPLEYYLENPSYPDSLKEKIKLVQEIRQYAIDSLGLNDTKSYYKVYDQKGEEVLWNVSACPPFELKPYEWAIPFAGKFPYHGHFNYSNAREDYFYMKKKGFDVGFRSVAAWSSQGWSEDPILSNMLYWEEGQLAETIIHEMTHGTIFDYSDAEFNENLATFVGELGAIKFLNYRYGLESNQLVDYRNRKDDVEKYIQHMLTGASVIDSLYKSFDQKILIPEKIRLKETLIKDVMTNIDTITFRNANFIKAIQLDSIPNNTKFASIIRYRGRQTEFQEVYKEKYKSNFSEYLEYLKKEYPL